MHEIAILAFHGFVPFDLGIPCGVFGYARLQNGKPAYRVRVCGEAREVRTSAFNLRVAAGLRCVRSANTVIIPGREDVRLPMRPAVIAALRAAWSNGARIASICSGAFVLAEAGLLDGRRATTHWIGAADLARRFPAVRVDPQVLFADEGRIITSAGAAAGLDMCLHLVRRDHGQAVAAAAARLAVAPLDRDGGQAQFIRYEVPTSSSSLAPLLEWMRANIHQPMSMADLSARACTSPRTLARRFSRQTGTTLLQWVLRARIVRAQQLLETTSSSIEAVAGASGFESAVTFRSRFKHLVGVSPSAYRARFNAAASPDDS